jgi:hypothetical protein
MVTGVCPLNISPVCWRQGNQSIFLSGQTLLAGLMVRFISSFLFSAVRYSLRLLDGYLIVPSAMSGRDRQPRGAASVAPADRWKDAIPGAQPLVQQGRGQAGAPAQRSRTEAPRAAPQAPAAKPAPSRAAPSIEAPCEAPASRRFRVIMRPFSR